MAEPAATGERSSLGMDANLAAALGYVLGIITGLVFFILEKRSRLVRFHAMQSILFSGALFIASVVFGVVPFIGAALEVLLWFGGLIVWIVLMIKAYQGEYFKLPIIGDFAEKNATPSST